MYAIEGKFGPSIVKPDGNQAAYPSEMRRQLWPLCCGSSILSGFKAVGNMTEAELVKAIKETIEEKVPDLQVFEGEQMRPALTWLTLNASQTASPKIMKAIAAAGFVKVAECQPRGDIQAFFVKDTTSTFKSFPIQKALAVA